MTMMIQRLNINPGLARKKQSRVLILLNTILLVYLCQSLIWFMTYKSMNADDNANILQGLGQDKDDHEDENNITRPIDVYLFPGADKMSQIQTFDELKEQTNLSNNLPVPRNLNILFLGDSLTRYMYLDMVYFLKHGSWVNPADKPNFVLETHHKSWNDFFSFTKGKLEPYEECDCYREGGVTLFKESTIFENRYFRDEERNNTVTFLLKFSSDFMKSTWNVSDIHKPHTLKTKREDMKVIHWLKWVEMIEEFVCKMEPKPSMFIFNAGLWAEINDLPNVTLQGEIVEALRKCDIMSMFKTTTKKLDQYDRNFAEYENQLCNQTDYCLDLTWTGMVQTDLYWDYVHFTEPVYSYMNLELLSLLSSIDGFLEI